MRVHHSCFAATFIVLMVAVTTVPLQFLWQKCPSCLQYVPFCGCELCSCLRRNFAPIRGRTPLPGADDHKKCLPRHVNCRPCYMHNPFSRHMHPFLNVSQRTTWNLAGKGVLALRDILRLKHCIAVRVRTYNVSFVFLFFHLFVVVGLFLLFFCASFVCGFFTFVC